MAARLAKYQTSEESRPLIPSIPVDLEKADQGALPDPPVPQDYLVKEVEASVEPETLRIEEAPTDSEVTGTREVEATATEDINQEAGGEKGIDPSI
ncbi:hypothetical protein LWI29_026784 [Acer saccharum]|uniref:Uncharacterized protein n=1 Tax=Acer saccharum TaxID=4024 RepID=A0AA39TWI7_ACESA|nr:hypothetical protein LWI29_026784 [Acer saccharum]